MKISLMNFFYTGTFIYIWTLNMPFPATLENIVFYNNLTAIKTFK